ncbi:MAG: oxidoreductase [Candidatus Kariarchaeaceae archaeon]|jgi:NAD(P)-dependent dehydrogenase (short-subunit alcohol dehydrogenase family)
MNTTSLKNKKWKAEDMPDQTGKVMIITGANSGLGLYASMELARKGATVIMTSRNIDKGHEAVEEIKQEIPHAKVELMQLDLSKLSSVKSFTGEFNEKYERLDALINNAGIMQPPYTKTEDGFELQIGVNHFGHYVLTGLLLEKLKNTPGSRVINQSSMAHSRGKMNFDDINSEKKYSRLGAYGQSKLANLLFNNELNRLFKENSIDSIAIGVHPGYTATNLQHNGPTLGGKSLWSRIYTITNKLMAQCVDKGILPMLYAATEDDLDGGDYIGPGRFSGARGYPKRVKASDSAYNQEVAKRLWGASEDLTGVKYNF